MDAPGGISQKGYIFKFLSRQSQGVPRAEAESLRRESAKKELLLQGMENIEAEREREGTSKPNASVEQIPVYPPYFMKALCFLI